MTEANFISGIPIIITDAITKQVRSRTHKKKRIDKKWLKRYGYKTVTDDSKCIFFHNTLHMSQKCYERIKQKVSNSP